MSEKKSTQWIDVNEIQEKYLPISKKAIRKILKENLDHCLRIPMNENIRALNLSNSVAVMVFEVLRQQNYPGLLYEEPFKGADYLEK